MTKETPLKPYKENTDGYVDDLQLYGFCPECGYDFNFDNGWVFGRPPAGIAERFPRCPACGQRIDWVPPAHWT